MNAEVLKHIQRFIKQVFFYIDYPEITPDGFWKDRNGRLLSVMSMNQEELKECVIQVDRDLDQFENVVLDDDQQQALGILLPLAHDLKHALEEELSFQIQEEDQSRKDAAPRFDAIQFDKTPLDKTPSDKTQSDKTPADKTQFNKTLEEAPVAREALEQFQKRSVSVDLPKWIVDRLKQYDQSPSALVEASLKRMFEATERAAAAPDPDPAPGAGPPPPAASHSEASRPDTSHPEASHPEPSASVTPDSVTPDSDAPPPEAVADAAPPAAIVANSSPILVNSVESILRFSRLALSYDFPRQTIVNYLKLIEKTARRMRDELRRTAGG